MRVRTDLGDGYLKAMGNPAGEHALACELVGTQLAAWFGLPVFDFAIIDVIEADSLPFAGGGFAQPGPAFITRAEKGEPWSGKVRELKRLTNPEDISRLIVFDTWTLNCDRHVSDRSRRPNRNNVFLSEEAPRGKFRLRAMDHTHCFDSRPHLSTQIANIDRIRDPRVFGFFPEFQQFLNKEVVARCTGRLRQVTQQALADIAQTIPPEWDVDSRAKEALVSLLLGRASFVAERIIKSLWEQRDFGFMRESEDDQ
ncbi:MAG: hypothetical protein JW809_12710 [Pirellulales bacterium]|nr:hypothetical protein [Pirellulales bacterium]